jgi:nucleotide-binding universal stress UspA family protein
MGQIIVGVDESEGAAAALRWGVREARVRDWSLAAVLAWDFLDQHHGAGEDAFEPSYSEPDALTALDSYVAAAVGPRDATWIERVATCDIATRALLDASKAADLLVVGARGLGGFQGLMLGSVSQQCVRHASCPVAVVRHATDPRGAGGRPNRTTMERIVVGIDGSDAANEALDWALTEGRLRHAAVDVVHAWLPPYMGGYAYTAPTFDLFAFEAAARALLDTAVDRANTSDLTGAVERHLVTGGATSAILELANQADLVVVGSRGLGGFSGLLLGSVSDHVTHHAPCPVVVVRSS